MAIRERCWMQDSGWVFIFKISGFSIELFNNHKLGDQAVSLDVYIMD